MNTVNTSTLVLSTDNTAIDNADYASLSVMKITEEQKTTAKELTEKGDSLPIQFEINGLLTVKNVVFLNYSGFVFTTETDDLYNSIIRNGVLTPVQLRETTEENTVVIKGGNHRVFLGHLAGKVIPAIMSKESAIDLSDKKATSFFLMEQTLLNKNIKRDSKEMLKMAVNALKAGNDLKDIASVTGVTVQHVQKMLKVSGNSAYLLKELGFDILSNPFFFFLLEELLPVQTFATIELYNECIKEKGTSGGILEFIKKAQNRAEKYATAEKNNGDVKETSTGEQVKETEKIVVESVPVSVVNEKTGKKETTHKKVERVVEKSEQVYTFVLSAKELYTELVSIQIETENLDLKNLLETAFSIQ